MPAVYRIRDATEGKPLYALMGIIAGQVAILEEDLAQLYNNQFIETCSDWVVPYIGDLLGVRGLHTVTPETNPRAQVANTISYRSRKGTAAMLEQLARDVTRWDAKVVEYFQHLSTTQILSHLRPHNRLVDLRDGAMLQNLNSAFDQLAHTVEIRSGGKYNLSNLGIFLWRIQAFSRTTVTPFQLDGQRYLFHPLGINIPLYNLPETEKTITHLAERINVPAPLPVRYVDVTQYYGEGKSMALYIERGEEREIVPVSDVQFCNLSDHDGNWASVPNSHYAIDPRLGRFTIPTPLSADESLQVTFHYGCLDALGGGEYTRHLSASSETPLIKAATVQQGLSDLGEQSGIIELAGNQFNDNLVIQLSANQQVVIRSAENQQAFWILLAPLIIEGESGASLTFDGLLIANNIIQVRGELAQLNLRHSTLVPGIILDVESSPQQPTTPSLRVESPQTQLIIDNSIVGSIRAGVDCSLSVNNSIIDATDLFNVAYAALDDEGPGGKLISHNSTLIGKIHTTEINAASNTIFYAQLSNSDTWLAPVWAERRQEGCVRFSYVPFSARVPRRYQCHPTSADDPVYPHFQGLRYGSPFYGQLHFNSSALILQGAEDGSEMGVFHNVFQSQRLSNLQTRLSEFMPFGLEPVVFLAS